jgi:hypothetical protein
MGATVRTGSHATLAVALALVLGACGADTAEETADAPAAQDTATGGMAGMEGMPGMGGMSAMQLGSDMTAHMEHMQAMGSDSLVQMMPQHRQLLGNMMGQMNREMEGMNMADPRWTALTDSLRDDLARMPQMSADEMRAFMPEHHGRVTRLMEMHGGMMGGR